MKTVDTCVGPLLCWDQDDVTRTLEQTGTWDAHLLPAFNLLPADGWALDLGANIGFFTRYFAQHFPRVLAVEAHPETFKLLQANTKNLTGHVFRLLGAAYDRHCVLGLASSAVHGWTEPEQSFADLDTVPHVAGFSFVEDPAQQHARHEWTIQTLVLDEILPAAIPVRLIKVDVQGAALRALWGCQRIIARHRPRIVFEYESHVSQCRGDDWPAYEQFFADRHYTLERIPGPWDDYLAVPKERS